MLEGEEGSEAWRMQGVEKQNLPEIVASCGDGSCESWRPLWLLRCV